MMLRPIKYNFPISIHPPPDWTLADLFRAFMTISTGKQSAKELEDGVGKTLAISYAIATNLGRTAITIGLRALGLKEGSGVILPTLVCVTAVEAVLAAGLRPILVDVERNLHVSIKTLDAALCHGAKAAIVPHLYGLHAPISDIEDWAKSKSLYLVDDAAQAFYISHGGKYLGTFGDMGILSFGPSKSLGTPRGGALITMNSRIYKAAENLVLYRESFSGAVRRIMGNILKFHCRPYYLEIMDKLEAKKSTALNLTTNSTINFSQGRLLRISDFEAGLIKSASRRMSSIIKRRSAIAKKVSKMLRNHSKAELVGPGDAPYIQIPIRLKGGMTAEQAVHCFRSIKIKAVRVYRPLHFYNSYRKFAPDQLSVAEKNWHTVFVIPSPLRHVDHELNRLGVAFHSLESVN